MPDSTRTPITDQALPGSTVGQLFRSMGPTAVPVCDNAVAWNGTNLTLGSTYAINNATLQGGSAGNPTSGKHWTFQPQYNPTALGLYEGGWRVNQWSNENYTEWYRGYNPNGDLASEPRWAERVVARIKETPGGTLYNLEWELEYWIVGATGATVAPIKTVSARENNGVADAVGDLTLMFEHGNNTGNSITFGGAPGGANYSYIQLVGGVVNFPVASVIQRASQPSYTLYNTDDDTEAILTVADGNVQLNSINNKALQLSSNNHFPIKIRPEGGVFIDAAYKLYFEDNPASNNSINRDPGTGNLVLNTGGSSFEFQSGALTFGQLGQTTSYLNSKFGVNRQSPNAQADLYASGTNAKALDIGSTQAQASGNSVDLRFFVPTSGVANPSTENQYVAKISAIATNPGNYNGDLVFFTNFGNTLSERVRITTNASSGQGGAVGIGTSSPGAQLEVDAISDDSIGLIVKAHSGTQSANLATWQSSTGGTLASVDAAGSVATVGNVQAGTGKALQVGANSLTFALTAPTSGGVQGDACFNTAIASGQPEGWRCVAAGTWTPMANHP